MQLDCDTEKGGMKRREDFFVDFGGNRTARRAPTKYASPLAIQRPTCGTKAPVSGEQPYGWRSAMVEWNAAEYNRQASLQAALAEEQLARLTFQGSERVLDVGCGDGRITAGIADRVPDGSVVGVDPSRDMIAFASSHFATPARPNLCFEVADARALPYQAAFDRILSFNALHWVPQQSEALRAIRTALKDNGRAAAAACPTRVAADPSRTFWRTLASPHAGPLSSRDSRRPSLTSLQMSTESWPAEMASASFA